MFFCFVVPFCLFACLFVFDLEISPYSPGCPGTWPQRSTCIWLPRIKDVNCHHPACYVVSLRQAFFHWLVWASLCGTDRPQPYTNLPSSAFLVLGSEEWAPHTRLIFSSIRLNMPLIVFPHNKYLKLCSTASVAFRNWSFACLDSCYSSDPVDHTWQFLNLKIFPHKCSPCFPACVPLSDGCRVHTLCWAQGYLAGGEIRLYLHG